MKKKILCKNSQLGFVKKILETNNIKFNLVTQDPIFGMHIISFDSYEILKKAKDCLRNNVSFKQIGMSI